MSSKRLLGFFSHRSYSNLCRTVTKEKGFTSARRAGAVTAVIGAVTAVTGAVTAVTGAVVSVMRVLPQRLSQPAPCWNPIDRLLTAGKARVTLAARTAHPSRAARPRGDPAGSASGGFGTGQEIWLRRDARWRRSEALLTNRPAAARA